MKSLKIFIFLVVNFLASCELFSGKIAKLPERQDLLKSHVNVENTRQLRIGGSVAWFKNGSKAD